MIRKQTPKQWFEENVDMAKLELCIIQSLADAVANENIDDDDTYVGLVHDIISSGNGSYIPYLALEYFGYEVNTNKIEQYDIESTMWELEKFTSEVSKLVEENITNEDISVGFGHWESDGTYCMMAYMNKDDYEAE